MAGIIPAVKPLGPRGGLARSDICQIRDLFHLPSKGLHVRYVRGAKSFKSPGSRGFFWNDIAKKEEPRMIPGLYQNYRYGRR